MAPGGFMWDGLKINSSLCVLLVESVHYWFSVYSLWEKCKKISSALKKKLLFSCFLWFRVSGLCWPHPGSTALLLKTMGGQRKQDPLLVSCFLIIHRGSVLVTWTGIIRNQDAVLIHKVLNRYVSQVFFLSPCEIVLCLFFDITEFLELCWIMKASVHVYLHMGLGQVCPHAAFTTTPKSARSFNLWNPTQWQTAMVMWCDGAPLCTCVCSYATCEAVWVWTCLKTLQTKDASVLCGKSPLSLWNTDW